MSQRAWVLVAFVLVGIGCASGAGAPPSSGSSGTREQTRRVTMEIRVQRVSEALRLARAAAQSAGGFVESRTASDEHAHLELRVPAASLDEARESLEGLGDVAYATEEIEDVTLAHADQEARIASAREEEARLAAMFSDRTASLADVLAVEHELSRVRETVERLDAEERALRDRIAMARLSIELVRAEPSLLDDPVALVARAGGTGARVAGALVVVLAASIAALAPSALVLLALARLARFARRHAARAAAR